MHQGGRPNLPATFIGSAATGASPLYGAVDLIFPVGVTAGDLAVWMGEVPSVGMSAWTSVGNITAVATMSYKPLDAADIIAGKFTDTGGNSSMLAFFRGPAKAVSANWTNNPSGGSGLILPGWTKLEQDALYLMVSGRNGVPAGSYSIVNTCGSGQSDLRTYYGAVSSYTSGADVTFNSASGSVSYGAIALRNW